MRKAQDLEKPLAIAILLALLENDAPSMGALASAVGKSGKGTVLARVKDLRGEGLLIDEQEEVFPRKKGISLTPKGRRVAEHLQAIDDEMTGQ